MSVLKNTLFKVLAAIGCLTSSIVGAADLCECGFTIGGDFLYWSPCISNMHYVSHGTSNLSEPENEVSYLFISSDWDSGFRIYLGKEDLFGCFDVMATYTNFSAKQHEAIFEEEVFFRWTWPTPISIEDNHYAVADWEMDFQRIELVAGYSIEFGKGCCIALQPFSGVDTVYLKQDRVDQLMDVMPKAAVEGQNPAPAVVASIIDTMTRSIDYEGIGPMVGMGYYWDICEGLATFGRASLSLLVGKADLKDIQSHVETQAETNDFTNLQNYEDKCFCVPNLHLQTGISYKACVCNKWLTFRIGYEYLQYLNAPSQIMYDTDHQGSITGLNLNSVTLQGVFGGIAFAF